MNDKEFIENLKKEILNEAYNYYFDSLKKSLNGTDKSWLDSKELYNSLDDKQKERLKSFIRLVMIDTISSILGKLDNISSFSNQKGLFELRLNDKVISGDLQDIFLEQMENEN
ncbi:hypothetical protein A9G48_00330 [Gilliamella sp. wkB18]|jgi:hypothetical protein|uniref:hypothetical protein n=1 Tax=Gilliamella sp. wkB18 TaxID=3120260 RepID=UPI00080D98C7|nr:hypothetical protein [Gilliamella apicola]OCG64597.1 hypothetical protein A9G48_00330 [Gilliamella apicola]